MEVVGVTVSVSALIETIDVAGTRASGSPTTISPDHDTSLFDEETGDYRKVNVYLRNDLPAGTHLDGPLLVRDQGTTIVVPGNCTLGIAADDSLIIERGQI